MTNERLQERKLKKREYDIIYRKNNQKKIKDYRDKTRAERNAYNKKYRVTHKARLREYNREYLRKYTKARAQRDPLFKLTIRVRTLIGNAIRNQGYRKTGSTQTLLGCAFTKFKQHIEQQFKPGMRWDNYGKWQIDHIVPIVSAQSEPELLKLNHYKNLQPLWAADNLRKRYA